MASRWPNPGLHLYRRPGAATGVLLDYTWTGVFGHLKTSDRNRTETRWFSDKLSFPSQVDGTTNDPGEQQALLEKGMTILKHVVDGLNRAIKGARVTPK